MRGSSEKLRVFVPATVTMLRELVANQQLRAVDDTAFAVTPSLRESYAFGDDEELAEVAKAEGARASLRLLASDQRVIAHGTNGHEAPNGHDTLLYRRAVVAADVAGAAARPDLDDAVVRLAGPIAWNQVASVHLDLAEAEPAVRRAIDVIDAADLGDEDAEFVLGDAEDHQLAWYAPQELPFLLDLS